MKKVSFYFDPISPYAWLAWRPLLDICRQHNGILHPVPVLFAGLLNKHGQLGPAEIPAKRLYLIKDVARRAASKGFQVNPPPTHPFNPLLALRTASLHMDQDKRIHFITKLLDACWLHGQDISDPVVISSLVDSCGLSGSALVKQAQTDNSIKELLRLNTKEAIDQGVFGVPSVIVNGELFWGSEHDTLAQVQASLTGQAPSLDTAMLDRWTNTRPSASRK